MEDRASLHLAENVQKRTAPLLSADDLPLRDLDAKQKARAKVVLGGFEHLLHPEYKSRCNKTENHIDIVPGARPQYSQAYRQAPKCARSYKRR